MILSLHHDVSLRQLAAHWLSIVVVFNTIFDASATRKRVEEMFGLRLVGASLRLRSDMPRVSGLR